MTLPREVIPGRAYMLTRRCTQRQFLLRPDEEANNAFLYCLGVALDRTGVRVFTTAAQSNHHHTCIVDRDGKHPQFTEYFHKLVAKCMNSLRGRWENFWSSEQTSVVQLVNPEDVLDKMVYALTNPAKDDLVERAEDWPGVNSFDAIVNRKTITAIRPRHFFTEDGTMPKAVTISFDRPPGFENMSDTEFAEVLTGKVRAVEAEASEKRKLAGKKVMGAAAILAQDWRARPRNSEPRRQLNPRIAARNRWSRIEAILRNREFIRAYKERFADFKKGVRDLIFPVGTYWLKRFAGVICATANVVTVATAVAVPAPAG